MPVSSDIILETLNRHRLDLTGYAWVVVGDPQLAEDVYQDILLIAIKKADQIDSEQHILPWLRNAIRLRGLEIRRNRSRHASLLDPEVLDLLEATANTQSAVSESRQMESLRVCVDALPVKSRDLLGLRYSHDLKPAEIAEKSGKSHAAVYKSINRIHLLLKDCVKRRLAITEGES